MHHNPRNTKSRKQNPIQLACVIKSPSLDTRLKSPCRKCSKYWTIPRILSSPRMCLTDTLTRWPLRSFDEQRFIFCVCVLDEAGSEFGPLPDLHEVGHDTDSHAATSLRREMSVCAPREPRSGVQVVSCGGKFSVWQDHQQGGH